MTTSLKDTIIQVLHNHSYKHHHEGEIISEARYDDIAEELAKIISSSPSVSGCRSCGKQLSDDNIYGVCVECFKQ